MTRTSEVIFPAAYPDKQNNVPLCDLSHNNLHLLNDNDLASALSVTPEGPVALRLNDNALGFKAGNALMEALNARTVAGSKIVALDLEGNSLDRKSTEEIIKLFSSFSDLETLNLSRNNLGKKSSIELAAIARSLPPVKNLIINVNEFNESAGESLMQFLVNLPDSIEMLGLGRCRLGAYHKGYPLMSKILELTRNVHALDLSDNGLNLK